MREDIQGKDIVVVNPQKFHSSSCSSEQWDSVCGSFISRVTDIILDEGESGHANDGLLGVWATMLQHATLAFKTHFSATLSDGIPEASFRVTYGESGVSAISHIDSYRYAIYLCTYIDTIPVGYTLYAYAVSYREGSVYIDTLPVRCTQYTYDASYRELRVYNRRACETPSSLGEDDSAIDSGCGSKI